MENMRNELNEKELNDLIGPDIKLSDEAEGIEEYERLQMEFVNETDPKKKDALEVRLNVLAETLHIEEVA